MLMRLMSKSEFLIVPKGTKFTGSGKSGLKHVCSLLLQVYIHRQKQKHAESIRVIEQLSVRTEATAPRKAKGR